VSKVDVLDLPEGDVPYEGLVGRERPLWQEHDAEEEGALSDGNRVDETPAKGPDEEAHGEEVSDEDLGHLPKLWPEIVVRLWVIEQVNTRYAEESEVDESYDAELDGRAPVKVQVLKQ